MRNHGPSQKGWEMSNSANISTKNQTKPAGQQLAAGSTHHLSFKESKSKVQHGGEQPPKTDFMQTQTFHRRNMSNLINMADEEDVPDHMLISRGGPARRTLEQIEQCSNFDEGGDGTFDNRVAGEHAGNDLDQRSGTNERPQENPYDDDMGLMDSQESAAENADFRDLNSNFMREHEQPAIPKEGFFDMVEHPSIRDEEAHDDSTMVAAEKQGAGGREQFEGDEDEDDEDQDVEDEYDDDFQDGDFPMTGRQDHASGPRLDSGRGDSSMPDVAAGAVITPGGQSTRSPHPYDAMMELSELHHSTARVSAMHQKAGPDQPDQLMVQGSQLHAPNRSQHLAHRASPTGEISQATNESCSSLDTMGHQQQMMLNNNNANGGGQNQSSAHKDRHATDNSPSQAYGGGNYQVQRPASGDLRNQRPSMPASGAARMQVYQYYPNNDEDDYADEVDSHDERNIGANNVNNSSQEDGSQDLKSASPSPMKTHQAKPPQQKKNKFYNKLQIEIDSDEEHTRGPQPPRTGQMNRFQQVQRSSNKQKAALPSAPKQQSNFIQFEEVQDAAHVHDDITRENAYELYGGGHHLGRSAGAECDTPGLPREQQISSQKMLTPNEQRMHSSYFPNDAGLQRALPSTKSYQTPVTQSNQLGSSGNPFMTATDGIGISGGAIANHRGNSNSLQMVPLDTGHETNSVSTANAQYYYLKGNGQIGFGQQESQSRASDRIYEKAHNQGMSPGYDQQLLLDGNLSYSDNNNHTMSQQQQQQQQMHRSMASAKDERMEAEIRRLEELNRIEAQRFREPQTTDEESPSYQQQQESELRRLQEEETRANCPDEYNLLSATVTDDVESVEALKNTSNEFIHAQQDGGTPQGQQAFQQQHLSKPDMDLNDRESVASGGENGSSQNPLKASTASQHQQQLSANGSYRTSMTGDRASRRLYVITEESQSMAGGQTMDPSRATADYLTMKQLWNQNARSSHPASGGNANEGTALQQQHPLMQQNAIGYGFLKASTHSQELPLYDPQSRRLTVGSSNNTAEGRTSCLIEGTPNQLELQGSHPQQSLNQTMQVHSSPQVQTFNAYCHQDIESSNMTNDQQFISMAQIHPSADASVVKNCQDDVNNPANMMLHQRSKSQNNAAQVSNFTAAGLKQQNQQLSQYHNNNADQRRQEITIRDDSASSPLQIYEERKSEYGGAHQQNISMTAGKVQQSGSHQPSKFQHSMLVVNKPGQTVPRSATTSTVKQGSASGSGMVLEQQNHLARNAGPASQHNQYPNASGDGATHQQPNASQSANKLGQPYLYQQFNSSAHPYTGPQDQQNNMLAAMQSSSHASTFQRDQDLMSAYLKQTSTVTTGGDRRPTLQSLPQNHGGDNGKPFEIASDEDLLNSNFDRISKILPNHDQINEQLPDFNPEESVHNSKHELHATNDSINQQQTALQVQILLAEIQQLKQTIMQRNQVIGIKDNTIAELKNEFGMRSSVAGMTTNQAETRDAGVLALPDTREVKCQTHGPRKQAYYRSIPAKVQTNLPNRSPSASFLDQNSNSHDCSHDHGHGGHSQPSRYHSFQKAASKMNSFAGVGGGPSGSYSPGKSQPHPISNSYSPSNRRKSPPKGGNPDSGSQANDVVRSLRLQLTSLKKQLTAQEQDNMTLIQKVTALEDTIETQEKNYDLLQMELEERVTQNASLVERNEELIKQVDSLLADNTELRQQKSLSVTSDQLQKLLQDRKAADQVETCTQTEDLLWQDFLSNQLHNNSKTANSSLLQVNYQQQQPQQAYSNQQSNNPHQHQLQQNDQFSDYKQTTQRSQHSQNQLLSQQQQTAAQQQNNNYQQFQPSNAASKQNSILGAGLITSNHNSRVLDQLSEVMSVGQDQQQMIAITNDQERIQVLAEKAKSYEHQQARIEQEIAQYKKLLLDVQIPTAATTTHQGLVYMTATTMQQHQPGGPQPFNIATQQQQQQNAGDNNGGNFMHGHHSSDLLNVSEANVKRDSQILNNYHQNQHQHNRQPSNISASPNVNIQDYMNTQDYMLKSGGTMSFEFNKNSSQNLQTTGMGTQQAQQLAGIVGPQNIVDLNTYGTNAGHHTTVGIVSMTQQQQIGYLHNKCLHQKRKLKKFKKKNHKLELEKMQLEQGQGEMIKNMDQLNEKYRDLRAKYQLKLQEKNLKISELKNQLSQRYTPNQMFTGSTVTPVNHTNANTSQIHSQPPLYNQISMQHQQAQQQITSYGDLSSTLGSNQLAQQQIIGPPQVQQHHPQASMTHVGGGGGVLSSEGRGEQRAKNRQQQQLPRTDTSQEDNKGQNRCKRQRQGGSISPPLASSSFQNQSRGGGAGGGPSAATGKGSGGANFYTIVSGMVDQRIAEHHGKEADDRHNAKSQKHQPLEGNSAKQHQSNKDNQRSVAVMREYSKKWVSEMVMDVEDEESSAAGEHKWRPRRERSAQNKRPDLEILRDNRKVLKDQQSPSEMLISCQNLVSSSEEKDDVENFDLNDRNHLQQHQMYWKQTPSHRQNPNLLTNQSSAGPQHLRQSRDSQPKLASSSHPTEREPRPKTLSSSPKKRHRETLAESYARKVMASKHQHYQKRSPSEKLHQHSSSRSPDYLETRIRKATNKPKKGAGSRFRSKSSEKLRDVSLRSAVSKDDVMPCYKYKVDGRKRNQVEYQPPVSLMSYLAQQQPADQHEQYRQREQQPGHYQHQMCSPDTSLSQQSPPGRQAYHHPRQKQRQDTSQETGRQLGGTGEGCEGAAIGINTSQQHQPQTAQNTSNIDVLAEARIRQMLREHQMASDGRQNLSYY